MTRRASGLILCTFVVISGCSDNFTEQIIQNEEEDISDIDDAEQHNDSFKSSPDQELETFSLNIWYILLAAGIVMSFLFLLNFVLSKEIVLCQKCPEWRMPGRRQERVKSKKGATIPCYLCDKKVIKSCWLDGSHRRHCASKKRALLERMPRPLEVNCPKCKLVLRLWPANLGLGEGYICDSIDCKTSKDEVILNSGYNRLNCFVCDYDLCMTCANRLVCQKQNVKPNVSYTGLAARNWMVHMNPLANKSIESNQSSGKDKNSSRKTSSTPTVAANALAALALGGVSRRSRKNRSTKRRASSSSYPSRSRHHVTSQSCRSSGVGPTYYARRHGSGGISTSAKSLPQPKITRLLEEELTEVVALPESPEPKRCLRGNLKRPPFSKAVSLDYDDSRHTYSSQTTASSKHTTVRIEDIEETDLAGDTSEDEDTDDALMMTAISEVEAAAAARSQNARIRMRTVSTVRPPTYLNVDNSYPKRGQKRRFFGPPTRLFLSKESLNDLQLIYGSKINLVQHETPEL